jgi:glucokinase
VVSRDRRATDVDGGFDAVVAQIADAVQGLVDGAEGPVNGVGVGVAGQVRAGDGVVTRAPNLDWDDAPLRSALEDALGRPVSVLNDVRAAAWGEWKHGAGRGSDDVTVVFVGTGVGGSVVSGGRVLTGATNMAGELGHLTVVAHGRECRCGNRGCLEAYAGGWGIAERAREAVAASPDEGAGLVSRAGSVEAITAETVHDARADGDPLAVRLVDETAGYLAAGLVGVVNAFNPGALVLGGGIVEHAPLYVDRVRDHVMERALPAGVRDLRVVRAELGGRAGAIGAATHARAERDNSNTTGSSG